MAKFKFTVKRLQALKAPPSGQVDYWNTDGPGGFGIRVSQGGSKSFFLAYRRDGKLRRWTIGRFPATTLAEARDQAKKTDANRDDPVERKAKLRRAETFLTLAAQYFWSNRRALKRKTIRERIRITRKELLPHFGEMKPHEITRGDIKALLNRKAGTGTLHMSNRTLETVRRIFSWGVQEDKIQASPCIGIKKPGGKEKPRERVLDTREVRKIWEAIEGERPVIAGFFKMLFLTAARRGEVLGTRWSDIDFEQNLWTISDTKNNTSHTVPLSREAVRVLQGLNPQTGHSDYVFLGPTGRAIANPQKAVARLRTNTNIEFRIHDIRRTSSTGLAQLGVRPDVISAILNHIISGPQATRIYERHHRIPEMRHALQRWASRLEDIVSGNIGEVVAFPGNN